VIKSFTKFNSNLQVDKIDTFSGHRGAVFSLLKGLDNHLFFSAGADGMIVQWNLQKPDLGKVIAQVEGSVYAMFLEKENDILWIGQNYEGIHGVRISDQCRVFSIKLDSLSIFDIQLFNNQVWVAHNDGLITVIDLETKNIIKHIKVSQKSARKIIILDESRVAVAYSDGFIRIFDINYNLLDFWAAHSNSIFSLAYLEESKELISVGRDAKVKKWSIKNPDFKANPKEVNAHIYAINDVVFHPNQPIFATASMDKTIKIWQLEEMKLLKVIDAARHGGHKNSVNKLIWTDFEDQLISGSDDKNISVWKIH